MVYLARCRDGSLYTGITTDPDRRLQEHNRGRGGAYTRSRQPVTLVYREPAGSRSEALRRERAIKCLTRAAKEALVRHPPGAPTATSANRGGRRHPLQLPGDPPALHPARTSPGR